MLRVRKGTPAVGIVPYNVQITKSSFFFSLFVVTHGVHFDHTGRKWGMYFLLVGKRVYTFVVLGYKEVFLGINSEIMYEKQIFWSQKTYGFGVRTVHPTPWGGGRNTMNATFSLLVSLYSWGGGIVIPLVGSCYGNWSFTPCLTTVSFDYQVVSGCRVERNSVFGKKCRPFEATLKVKDLQRLTVKSTLKILLCSLNLSHYI